MGYDLYNREERALFFHFFRLLHEKWGEGVEGSALTRVLRLLSAKNINFKNAEKAIDLSQIRFTNVAIFPEVTLIRDAFKHLKPNPNDFMNGLIGIIKKQEGADECRLYSELPSVLCDYQKTHPKQIRAKARTANVFLNAKESLKLDYRTER